MGALTIKANEKFDLSEVYDRIADGELGDLVAVDTIDAPSEASALFGAGRGRIPKITIQLKHEMTEEECASLRAKLLEMFGSKAHIHIEL